MVFKTILLPFYPWSQIRVLQLQSNSNLFKTDFCLQLASQVLEEEAPKGTNFVASPLLIHVILSLITAGSTGKTLEQLLFVLGSPNVSHLNLMSSYGNRTGGPLLSFVNGAWLDGRFNLKPSFDELVKSSYKAKIENVDFLNKPDQAVDEVNSWAENATEGLITKLLPYGCVDDLTVLILANALYFKGSWHQKFDTRKTRDLSFHLLNGQTVRAPFMTTETFERHLYRCFDGVKVLQIPYQSGQEPHRFSMYFFLPDEKDGLLNLIQMIKSNPAMLNRDFGLTKDKLVDFWIPKFKFSFDFEASKTIGKMGVDGPFHSGDLRDIVDCPDVSKDLFVSKIFHKSFIEVTEEGTEAAAITACIFEMQQCIRYPSFVADHPFLFMIREETSKAVLFVGAVLNPLQNS
ncbi:hypothetical protein UlMin_014447 [Ulmus minor]